MTGQSAPKVNKESNRVGTFSGDKSSGLRATRHNQKAQPEEKPIVPLPLCLVADDGEGGSGAEEK